MSTSSITFLWQFETFVALYCNDYFNGHTELYVDDGNELTKYELEEPTAIINDLQSGIYRVFSKGPDGQSEDKYIEVYPEGLEYQLTYLNNLIFNDELNKELKDFIIKISDERGLNLVETLYFSYMTNQEEKNKYRLFYLLLATIKHYNANNFYNNIDNNSSLYLNSDNQSLLHPNIVNGFLKGKINLYKFTGKFYEYQDTITFKDENIDLGFLDKDYLYRIDLIIDQNIVNSYYTIHPSLTSANLIWDKLNIIATKISDLTDSLRYLPLAYQSFDDDTKLAISMLLNKHIDNPVLQMPKIVVEDGEITALIDGANQYQDIGPIYFCVTDVEGLAADQVLVKKEIDNLVIDLPTQGNSIYDGNYFSYLSDKDNNILSPICLFNIDQDIEHKYIEETLRYEQTGLLAFLKEEFELEDVNKYYHYFTDCIGNSDVTLSNYYDKVIDRFVQINPYDELLDMIHYLNVYRYSKQVYKDIGMYVYNQETSHRVIIPNDIKNMIVSAVKFKRGENYRFEYKKVTDNAAYITYDDADYTVISIYDKETRTHTGLVTVWRNGNDYYLANWNVLVKNQIDF